jgi:hypothetical protein
MKKAPNKHKPKRPEHESPGLVKRASIVIDGKAPGRHEITVTFARDPKR